MCPHIASMLCGLAFLSACSTSALDVVYEVETAMGGAAPTGMAGAGAGGASSGAGGTDAGPCSAVGAGRYVLRSQANGLCLGQGAPTTVFGNPGFLLDFAADCRLPTRSWLLTASAVPNVFSIQNESSGFVLDVEMAAIRDGTAVITYGENGLDNQRFEVRARDAFASELRPQHHPQSCVGALPNGAQIAACLATDSAQAWLLQKSDCL